MLLAGCSWDDVTAFGIPEPATRQSEEVFDLWQGSWIAALIIGAFVWGLILWSAFRYRKRSDALPRQVRYNMPIEVLYTVIPFVIVTTFFYFTAVITQRQDRITEDPDVVIGVVGFQWNWQFNYVNEDLQVTTQPGQVPVLVLPTEQRIRFVLNSTDVQHSFWVPKFLFKRDVVPGRDNQFEIEITREGTYRGRCAEFCGVDHDRMIFEVRAVSSEEYDAFVAEAQERDNPVSEVSPGGEGVDDGLPDGGDSDDDDTQGGPSGDDAPETTDGEDS